MLYKIAIVLGAIVVSGVAGCQQPQTVLGSLPDPCTRANRNLAQAQNPGPVYRSRPLVIPPLVRPFQPSLQVRSVATAEPGWVPAIGISNRWTCLVIHHSASDNASPAAMDNAHRQRGWDELGYHFVIGNGTSYPDGQVYVGSRWIKQKHGAHCKVPGNYYNEHGIGICLMGDLDEHPATERQMQALGQLVMFLENQCGISQNRLLTHGGITGKTRCPGRYFSMNDLYRRVNAPMYVRR